jgi:hypothetical protein
VEVLEKNTDTAWALFEAVRRQQELGIPTTPPAAVVPTPAPAANAPASAPASGVSLDDVLLEVRRNNRVCPLPAIWKQVWDYLPNKGTTLSEVPATAAEWARLPPLQKRSRLREHLEFAASQGVLQQVYDALRKLPEDRWHHMGA